MPPWWTHEDSGHQGLGRIPGLQCTSWGRPSPSHQTYPGPGPRPAPLRPAGSSGFLGVGPLPHFPGWLMPCPGGWAGADPSPACPSSRRGRPVSLRTPRAVLAGPLLRRAGSHQDPARIPPRRLLCAAVGSSCVVCSLGRCVLWPPSLPSCWYPPRVFPGGPARDLTWRTIPMPTGRTGPAVAGRGVRAIRGVAWVRVLTELCLACSVKPWVSGSVRVCMFLTYFRQTCFF